MEIEELKPAWQKRQEETVSDIPASLSPSLQYLRSSTIRDLQRSEELGRPLFSVLFALAAIGASWAVPPGVGRVMAWLLALGLLVDGLPAIWLMVRRVRHSANVTMSEFISREHRQVEWRLRAERYSQAVVFVLVTMTLLVLFFAPTSTNLKEVFLRMVIVTAFLAFAWRRTKTSPRLRETRRELEGYLKDIDK
jgi:hypothetical protein